MKHKRIIVTGCAGFIGSNLCISLLKDGDTVIGIDNLSTGQEKNLQELLEYPNFIFYKAHVHIDPFYILDIIEDAQEIYHLACPASPPKYQKDPIDTMMINVVGTNNILKMARRLGAKFLLTSTSETYGDPLEHPQKESYRGNVSYVGPRSCYDEGKRAAETLVYDYQRCYKMNVRVARIFNTYGPRMDLQDGRVVTNFIKKALLDEELTIYGEGLQTRSLCYITDMVDGLKKLMSGNYSGPVNLGNPEEVTIIKLAREIYKICNPKSIQFPHKFYPLPIDDPTKRQPDISLAKKELDWEPKVSRTQGLITTISYVKDFIK